ncbi:uncharacterized protein STEHIDRAFT_168370, partial [Stereum hirsutum FP-91666 SS1]|uniref:uncharacterized protein n=1 Tax=Stereum hirsutum (strain FP-91666) TaxID=721885 RepID=UPI000440BED6
MNKEYSAVRPNAEVDDSQCSSVQLLGSGSSTLPTELVLEIFGKLTKEELLRLRLVCTTLKEIADSFVFRSIKMINRRTRGDACRERLRAIASKKSPATLHTVHLDIGQLVAPSRSSGPIKTARYQNLENCLREYLEPAISALPNLRSMSWSVACYDSAWTYEVIQRAISSRTSLQRLDLTISRFTPVIERLPHLRDCRLKIVLPYDQPAVDAVTTQSAQFIAHNHQIERLEIVAVDRHRMFHQRINLPSLFGQSSGQHPLQLKKLDLKGLDMAIDESTAPHLRSLKELSLTIPYVWTTPMMRTAYLSLPPLLDAVIHVESLSLDYVNMDVLRCIASMNGLARLTFNFTSESMSDDERGNLGSQEADFFYAQVLKQHAQSLEHLSIDAIHDGPWSINEGNVHALQECQNLISLRIPVSRRCAIRGNTMRPVIDVLVALPKLSSLYLNIRPRYDVPGTMRIRAIEQLHTMILNLGTLDPSRSPRSIWIMDVEHPLQLNLKGEYRYACLPAQGR